MPPLYRKPSLRHELLVTSILCIAVSVFAYPVYAQQSLQPPAGVPATQQIGYACTPSANLETVRSYVPTQGVIECIPDSNGNFYWQPMGGGSARYDNTAICNSAGSLRWNGSAIQYCNGSSWQNIGGGQTLVTGGCQTSWSGCPSGYHPTSYFSPGTYNCCDRCGNPSWKYTVCSQ